MLLVDAQNRLKTLTASSTAPILSDAEITAILLQYQSIDYNGYLPANPDWVGTWDFNKAAHEGWMIKAGRVTDQFDFTSDVNGFTRDQLYKHCVDMAAKYISKRLGTLELSSAVTWKPVIGNLNDV